MGSKGFISNEIKLHFQFTCPCSTYLPRKIKCSFGDSDLLHFSFFFSNPQLRKGIGHVGRDETDMVATLILS